MQNHTSLFEISIELRIQGKFRDLSRNISNKVAMPPRDSPLETQLPLSIPGLSRTKSGGSWHVLIQSDIGNDCAGDTHIIKRRIDTGFRLPHQNDIVMQCDFRESKQASLLNRSMSTPPTFLRKYSELKGGHCRYFDVMGGIRCCSVMNHILQEIVTGIQSGVEPVAAMGGLGGAYYFRNCRGENIAIVKPCDEEPFAPNNPKGFVGKIMGELGVNRAVRVGETGIREVAAYLLDHKHFAKVPPTALVEVSHHAFHVNSTLSSIEPFVKIASCQEYVKHDFDASDHGSSSFSVTAVHRIGILDIRIFNTDRHAGNILVRREIQGGKPSSVVSGAFDLIPIDHGLCLPEALVEPYFEWLHWPQSSLPFSEEELAYIQLIDEYKDADMLRKELPLMREACLRTLILATTILKRTAAAGWCLAEIGELMSRDGIGDASQLELLCMQAKNLMDRDFADEFYESDGVDDDAVLIPTEEGVSYEQFEFDVDEEEDMLISAVIESEEFLPFSSTVSEGARVAGRYRSVSYVDGSRRATIGETGEFDFAGSRPVATYLRSLADVEPLNKSTNDIVVEVNVIGMKHKDRLADRRNSKPRSYNSYSFSNRKQGYNIINCRDKALASEIIGKSNIPSAFSMGDMDTKEWSCFLDHFKELLEEVILTKSDHNSGCGHKQRLGISCQF